MARPAATGWRARGAHYRALALRVAEGLARLGIEAVLDAEQSSCVLRSYRLPEGISYDALHDHLKVAGFVIYARQSSLADEIFRISTMGDLHSRDRDDLIARIADITAR